MRHSTIAVGLVAPAVLLAPGVVHAAGAATGPSSSESPYVVRSVPGVVTTSILTVGDRAPNGYRLVGLPDGLGAFDNGDGTFTLLVNHELGPQAGAVRDHGSAGAFVSRWTVDSETLEVLDGEDLIQRLLRPAAAGGWEPAPGAVSRLCSADLPPAGTFFDAASGAGTEQRLFLDGEENIEANGTDFFGRGLAHVVDGPDAGTSYVLPAFGHQEWENLVTQPRTGPQTVVVATNDDNAGQVFVYVGAKRTAGNDVERAGLTGGRLYGVQIEGLYGSAREDDSTVVGPEGRAFKLVPMPDVSTLRPGQIDSAAQARNISRMGRPEDAVWETAGDGLYFASTGVNNPGFDPPQPSFTRISRVWHLQFNDPSDVTAGGVARIALAGPDYDPLTSEAPQGPRMMDNLTLTDRGQVLIQEDTGNQPYVSGIWQLDPASGKARRVATLDPDRFLPGEPGFLTQSEESSGIIPAPFLGRGKYLITAQAHYTHQDPELVQGGQLLVLHVPSGQPVR
jgi:hypothetical protein